MNLKKFYSVPNFKKLKTSEKIIYVFAILIPLSIIYSFLHFYYLPFGYNKDLQKNDRAISIKMDVEKDLLDGVAKITVKPLISKRNVLVHAYVEEEGLYFIQPPIFEEDFLDVWDYVEEFSENFDYKILDEYLVNQDADFISFKLEYEIDWEKPIETPEIVLKYQNLKILQYNGYIELRVEETEDEVLKTYREFYYFQDEEVDSIVTLYANYKKPGDTNGFIELCVNGVISSRTVINKISQTEDEKSFTTIWNEELEKDFSQPYISLKEDEYSLNMLQNVPDDIKAFVNKKAYYEHLHKPNIDDSLENETDFDQYIYDENDPTIRYQIYHDKEFFNSFSGYIQEIRIGYDYPFLKKQTFDAIFAETPFEISIAGESTKFENIHINLYRKPLWKK
jgi:cell division protein FtsL